MVETWQCSGGTEEEEVVEGDRPVGGGSRIKRMEAV